MEAVWNGGRIGELEGNEKVALNSAVGRPRALKLIIARSLRLQPSILMFANEKHACLECDTCDNNQVLIPLATWSS